MTARAALTTTTDEDVVMATQSYHKRDLYTEVTSRILTELETGAAPWIKPWSNRR